MILHLMSLMQKKDNQLSFGEYAGAQVTGNFNALSGEGYDASGKAPLANGQIAYANRASDATGDVTIADGQALVSDTSYGNTVVGQAGSFGTGETSITNGANVMNGSANNFYEYGQSSPAHAVSSGYANNYGVLNGDRNAAMQWRLCYENETAKMNGALAGNNGGVEWFRCL